jgi:hypothetical protein
MGFVKVTERLLRVDAKGKPVLPMPSTTAGSWWWFPSCSADMLSGRARSTRRKASSTSAVARLLEEDEAISVVVGDRESGMISKDG